MNIYRVAFIGHRELHELRKIENQLEKYISNFICRYEYVEFYVGRNGEFDISVAASIKNVQKKQGSQNSTLILVLPYHVKDEAYYQKFYDELIIPLDEKTHPKAAITKRNQWMVDNADLLISYITHPSGGAFATVQYAKKQGVLTINLADDIANTQ